mmetsp:Transcript_15497/g.46794  ORF Transcript_15497/g.46794 Transcript_15497/m.46794 type:complete len:254 (+) Transcript_15497:609-1370(+)
MGGHSQFPHLHLDPFHGGGAPDDNVVMRIHSCHELMEVRSCQLIWTLCAGVQIEDSVVYVQHYYLLAGPWRIQRLQLHTGQPPPQLLLVLLSVSQVQLGEGALSQVEVVLDLRGHLCHAIHCCCDCLRGSHHHDLQARLERQVTHWYPIRRRPSSLLGFQPQQLLPLRLDLRLLLDAPLERLYSVGVPHRDGELLPLPLDRQCMFHATRGRSCSGVASFCRSCWFCGCCGRGLACCHDTTSCHLLSAVRCFRE